VVDIVLPISIVCGLDGAEGRLNLSKPTLSYPLTTGKGATCLQEGIGNGLWVYSTHHEWMLMKQAAIQSLRQL